MSARIRIVLFLLMIGVSVGATDQTLKQPKIDRYTMADGAVVSITRDELHDTLKAADGRIIVELGQREVLAEAVQSPNKKYLLCVLQTHELFGKGDSKLLGFNFSGLARISHSASGGWTFARVWKVDHNEWVRDLGAISDDGHRALFRVARKSAPVAPYSVGQEWQTWELDKNVLLKTGLSVE